MCVSCLPLTVGSFCKKYLSSAANFSQGEMCCGCKGVMFFQQAKLGSPCFHLLAFQDKKEVIFFQGRDCMKKQTYFKRVSW